MTSTDSAQSMTWRKRLVLFALGLALALGQAPFDLSFIYFLILPFIAWIFRAVPTAKVGFGVGWWLGFGYFALTLNWIVEPFLVDMALTGWMAPFALIGMSGGLALFWAVAYGATARLMPEGASRLVVLAVLWTLAEFARANVLTGFPWGHLSYGLIDLPLAQMAAWVGIHGTGLFLVFACFLPAIFAPRIWDGAFWMAVLLIIASVMGLWRASGDFNPNTSNTVVRLIQPNAAQHLKWDPDMVGVFYNRQIGYTKAKTPVRPDIVIWPETAIPYVLKDSLPVLQAIANASGPDTSVVAGIVRREDEAPRNSLVYLDPVGGVNAVFDKQHLVPFGEYFPLARVANAVGLSSLTGLAGRFKAGTGSRVIAGRNVPDFAALICYEAIFPQYSQADGKRPEWIVHITNDAWFGQFSGPYQHLAQARMRAIEAGLPVARSANTGVSAMIDPFGRIVESLDLGTAGYLDQTLPAPLARTLYSKLGEWLWMIFALGLFIAAFKPFLRAPHQPK